VDPEVWEAAVLVVLKRKKKLRESADKKNVSNETLLIIMFRKEKARSWSYTCWPQKEEERS
jgi:hypothetical protein